MLDLSKMNSRKSTTESSIAKQTEIINLYIDQRINQLWKEFNSLKKENHRLFNLGQKEEARKIVEKACEVDGARKELVLMKTRLNAGEIDYWINIYKSLPNNKKLSE